MSGRSVVLVTGGSGFLGQHVVKLLQTNADHVTEIRVLDLIPYQNKLDHRERWEVTSYTGSITDYDHVAEACKGVDSVLHIASFVDIRLFPDQQLSYNINVIGTETVIRACKAAGVKRLIYCSTVDVVMSQKDILDGKEDNTTPTAHHEHLFQVYGPTKAAAERLVVSANSPSLQTMSLRPVGLYGDLDDRCRCILDTVRTLGYYITVNTTKPTSLAYVGNIAWSFICADRTLWKRDSNAKQASGNVYFIADDTPLTDVYGIWNPMFQDAGAKPVPFALPVWFLLCTMYILYFILMPIRMLFNVNLSRGISTVRYLKYTNVFSYDKATKLLGYKPLFSVKESRKISTKYYKDVIEEMCF